MGGVQIGAGRYKQPDSTRSGVTLTRNATNVGSGLNVRKTA